MPTLLNIYFVSFLFFLSSQNWFILWMLIELNTILFLSLMISVKTTKEDLLMIYFLIQSMCSMIIMASILNEEMFMSMYTMFPTLIFLISILMKMANAPMHLWYTFIAMKLEKMLLFFLMTFQKINMLIILLLTKMNKSMFFFFFMVITLFIGNIHNMIQHNVKQILIFSSVSNNGWILLTLFLPFMSQFFFLYYMLLMSLFINFMTWENKTLMMNKKMIIFMMLMIASSIPPSPSFLIKVVMFYFCVSMSFFIILLSFVFISVLEIFNYIRVLTMWMSIKNMKNKWKKKKEEEKKWYMIFLLMIIPAIMIW